MLLCAAAVLALAAGRAGALPPAPPPPTAPTPPGARVAVAAFPAPQAIYGRLAAETFDDFCFSYPAGMGERLMADWASRAGPAAVKILYTPGYQLDVLVLVEAPAVVCAASGCVASVCSHDVNRSARFEAAPAFPTFPTVPPK